MTDHLASAFRERAEAEAGRYGPDGWVFVRELLQNARDAGAGTVRVETAHHNGVERLSFRDDGAGMSLAEARRYLFTLYASSKGDRGDQAGRFGVGFWSVLRFAPQRILIRSWPLRGRAWEVELDGRLERVSTRQLPPGPVGTEVVLERLGRDEESERQVREAVLRDAPFLRRRGRTGGPLLVRVNGNPVSSAPTLQPPSSSFRRPGLRGVVGLGREPRVDLHAFGLRVRTVAALDDLLVRGGRGVPAGGQPTLTRGLAPRVILDSDRLEVLLARGDARDTRELRRLVAVARRELARLVERQLDRWAPRWWPLRLAERLAAFGSRPRARLALLGLTLAVVVGVAAGLWLRGTGVDLPAAVPSGSTSVVAVADLAGLYRGPGVDLVGDSAQLDLSYQPASVAQRFTMLLVEGLSAEGRPPAVEPGLGPYPAAPCLAGCVGVELGLPAGTAVLRLPVPPGHRVDPASASRDGHPVEILLTEAGEAAVRVEGGRGGRLRYRTGPALALGAGGGLWPPLPKTLAAAVAGLRRQPVAERIANATALVRSRVAYDASPAVVERYRDARRRGLGLFDQAVAVGAGDCDVQNALLAALLAETGLPTRLAIGCVGRNGRALPGLHAWVEVLVGDRVVVADASAAGAGKVNTPAAESPAAGGDRALPAPPGSPPPPYTVPRGGAMAVLILVVIAGLAAVTTGWARGRGTRRLSLTGKEGLADLLRGALERPQLFAGTAGLAHRPLVPLVGGGKTSLARARRLQGRTLFHGSAGDGLATRAATAGAVVVDSGRPEGQVIAEGLGAVDLDAWQALLGVSQEWVAARAVERHLDRFARGTRVRLADRVGPSPRSLEVPKLGVRVVVVDRDGALAREVEALSPTRPALANLLLADALVRHLGLDPRPRRQLLRPLAAAALAEENRT